MKLFLAGAAGKSYLQEDLKSIRYALESFYYFKDWQIPFVKQHWKLFMADSGAFTFRESCKGKVDFERYTYKYAEFINRFNVQLFFEMDIDDVVGLTEVERLRGIIERETGRPSIPVWHIGRGKQYFIDMCREYPYVAIGGIAGGTREEYSRFQAYFPWFIKTAHQYGAHIHGLGFTPRNISAFGFDSVDSTSWMSGGRFGIVYSFQRQTGLTQSTRKNQRLKDYREVDQHNLREWLKFQRYLDNEV